MLHPEDWLQIQKILVILAHPDDPEFFCGASVARWASEGHDISYCLFTRGEKGSAESGIDIEQLKKRREIEQKNAAKFLGVTDVIFLDYKDGELFADLDARKSAVRVIRKLRPNIIITGDPNILFPRPGRINHPDHRAIGQIVLDAIFPAAGNPLYFPELLDEGLLPHKVDELWLSNSNDSDIDLDVTAYWDKKINAILEHTSQIADRQDLIRKLIERYTNDSTKENPRYIEKYRRIVIE